MKKRTAIIGSALAGLTGLAAGLTEEIAMSKYFDKLMCRDDRFLEQTSADCKPRDRKLLEQYESAMTRIDMDEIRPVSTISADGAYLSGKLLKMQDKANTVVLAIHGYHHGGMLDMAAFADMYRQNGCDCLIVSQRAHEESGGKYIGFGVLEKEDGLAWCQLLMDEYGPDVRIILHGLSMGAVTALLMCGDDRLPDNVDACVSDSAFSDLESQTKWHQADRPAWFTKLAIRQLDHMAKRKAGYSMYDSSPVDAVRKAQIPLLLIHGGDDRFVPQEMMEVIAEAAGEAVFDTMVVPGALHMEAHVLDPEGYEQKFSELLEHVR